MEITFLLLKLYLKAKVFDLAGNFIVTFLNHEFYFINVQMSKLLAGIFHFIIIKFKKNQDIFDKPKIKVKNGTL